MDSIHLVIQELLAPGRQRHYLPRDSERPINNKNPAHRPILTENATKLTEKIPSNACIFVLSPFDSVMQSCSLQYLAAEC